MIGGSDWEDVNHVSGSETLSFWNHAWMDGKAGNQHRLTVYLQVSSKK